MDKIEELKKLSKLLLEGAISEDEYNSLKREILTSSEKTEETKDEKEEESNVSSNPNFSKWDSIKANEALQKLGIQISAENLINFSYEGNNKIVALLLEAGVNPNSMFDFNGGQKTTALHYASFGGHIKTIKLLIQYGAKINTPDGFGFTPLFLAIEGGSIETVSFLINKGADIKYKNHNDRSPLEHAIKMRQTEMAELLKNNMAQDAAFAKRNSGLMRVIYFVGGFFLFSFLIGHCITNMSDDSYNNSQQSETISLTCPYCKETKYANKSDGLAYYKWETSGGCSWNKFYSGDKRECCSEKCCESWHYVNSGY